MVKEQAQLQSPTPAPITSTSSSLARVVSFPEGRGQCGSTPSITGCHCGSELTARGCCSTKNKNDFAPSTVQTRRRAEVSSGRRGRGLNSIQGGGGGGGSVIAVRQRLILLRQQGRPHPLLSHRGPARGRGLLALDGGGCHGGGWCAAEDAHGQRVVRKLH